jgi:hypothetical protein
MIRLSIDHSCARKGQQQTGYSDDDGAGGLQAPQRLHRADGQKEPLQTVGGRGSNGARAAL